MSDTWSPTSWQKKPIGQEVNYPDRDALASVLARLAELPPLVTSWEVETLRGQIADATRGAGFILQGGDCAERFGDRTRAVGGAHVEYFRGIANPIGVKVGPDMEPQELLDLIEVLNPDNEPGRLMLIHRFGADQIDSRLPPPIEAVLCSGRTVLWCCDPMHGNTMTTQTGIKTRSFDDILSELEQAFDIHDRSGSLLGGVHFELTGEDVTECIGGARGLREVDLQRAYHSDIDPRLNYEQALEMALLIAGRTMGTRRRKAAGPISGDGKRDSLA